MIELRGASDDSESPADNKNARLSKAEADVKATGIAEYLCRYN